MTIYTHTGLSAPTLNSVAEFRKWASLVDAMILACGWVQTADTGQSDPATLTVPGTNSTAAGYRLYSLDDALAGAAPVLLKVEWGRGTGATAPAVWFTIGTGSDGAGTITGTLQPRTAPALVSSGATVEVASYASGDGSSLNLTMWPTSTSVAMWLLRIERSRTLSGEPTIAGLAITIGGLSGKTARTIAHGGAPGSSGDALGEYQSTTLPQSINGSSNTPSAPGSLSQDGVTAPIYPIMHAAPGVPPWVSANLVALAGGDAGVSSLVVANTHGTERIFRAFPQVGSTNICDVRAAGGTTTGVAVTAQVWAEV